MKGEAMKPQTTLFDQSAFPAEPCEIPPNVKRIEFIPWVKQNAAELAREWHVSECREDPRFYDAEDSVLQWDFELGRTRFEGDDDNLIEQWLRTKYEEELRNG